MKARIFIRPKAGVLDPQGKAIQQALGNLGYDGVDEVRQGKLIELSLSENDSTKAEKLVRDMCERLLANTVIESYAIELVD